MMPAPLVRTARAILVALLVVGLLPSHAPAQDAAPAAIPLPEHPRPNWQREAWINLNGPWSFQFDAADVGERNGWHRGTLPGTLSILVPFPWGSPLSGVKDEAEIAWYARSVRTPAAWKGQRVFLVIGAADWRTTVWLDGHELGSHEGGYTPFEFDLTPHVRFGEDQRLVIRVDDEARDFKLEGKQGYGNARGIWQTPYLEARGTTPLDVVHFSPDIERGEVHVDARLLAPAPGDLTVTLDFKTGGVPRATGRVPRGGTGCASRSPCRRRASGGWTTRSSTRSKPASRGRGSWPTPSRPTSGCGASRSWTCPAPPSPTSR
jgi:hypothetical protein